MTGTTVYFLPIDGMCDYLPNHVLSQVLQQSFEATGAPEFDEKDREIFMRVFGDEDSADATVQVIRNAPPEIAVLTLQIMEMIRRAEGC